MNNEVTLEESVDRIELIAFVASPHYMVDLIELDAPSRRRRVDHRDNAASEVISARIS